MRAHEQDQTACLECGHPHNLDRMLARINKTVYCTNCGYRVFVEISTRGILYFSRFTKFDKAFQKKVVALNGDRKLLNRIMDYHIKDVLGDVDPEPVKQILFKDSRKPWTKNLRKLIIKEAIGSGIKPWNLKKLFKENYGTLAKETIQKYVEE